MRTVAMRTVGRRAGATAGPLALILSLLMLGTVQASPAHAADASGCSGQATSYEEVAEGEMAIPIDTAAAPGEGGTQEDPLDLVWAGMVQWSGTTDEVLQNGEYSVKVTSKTAGKALEKLLSMMSGLALSGPVTNESGTKEAEGNVVPADYTFGVPLMTGTYQVTWNVTGEAGSCTGTGYFKVIDEPWKSVTFWIAAIFIMLGFTGLLLARPTVRPGKG